MCRGWQILSSQVGCAVLFKLDRIELSMSGWVYFQHSVCYIWCEAKIIDRDVGGPSGQTNPYSYSHLPNHCVQLLS